MHLAASYTFLQQRSSVLSPQYYICVYVYVYMYIHVPIGIINMLATSEEVQTLQARELPKVQSQVADVLQLACDLDHNFTCSFAVRW